MTGVLGHIRALFSPAGARRTGKHDNGDGTTTERWMCGCAYTYDTTTRRILAESACPRHAGGRP